MEKTGNPMAHDFREKMILIGIHVNLAIGQAIDTHGSKIMYIKLYSISFRFCFAKISQFSVL